MGIATDFPEQSSSENPLDQSLERLNGERRTDVVGIFPTKRPSRPDRRVAARTERRMGRSAREIHDSGNDRAFE
jgi:hypothetical protein